MNKGFDHFIIDGLGRKFCHAFLNHKSVLDSHLKQWVFKYSICFISTPCLLLLENIELCSQSFFIITLTKTMVSQKRKTVTL